MSHRPSALAILATLLLVAVALGPPLLAAPAAAYGEHVFQANPVVGAGDPYYAAYSGSTLAQSILVSQDYILTNVTLRVRNDGSTTNPLVVSIHPDDTVRHVPLLSTTLASTSQVSPNNQPTPVNWSFPFSPSPTLHAGTVYWIVAQNAAPQAPPTNGYEWHESNGDTYANGTAYILDTGSGVWTGLPYDLFFVTYGRERASDLAFSMSADRAQALPGDAVNFTIGFGNLGSESARWAWVNVTLPAELENVSASFPDVQPVPPSAFPDLVFQNLANGAHTFTLIAQVAIGTVPGTTTTLRATLDYANATGAMTRGRQASASVLIGEVTKQLYLGNTSVATQLLTTTAPTRALATTVTLTPGAAQPLRFQLSPALARPFETDQVTLDLYVSTQKAPPQSYKLNISLYDNATTVAWMMTTFVVSSSGYHPINFSFGSFGHLFGTGHQISLSVWSAGGGGGSTDNLLLRFNGTSYPSHMDLASATYVSVDSLTLRDPATNGTTWSPDDPILIDANVSDPFGASRIRLVTVNVTTPANRLAASASMAVVSTDPSPLPAWTRFNFSLAPPLQTGRYRIDVIAEEDNGVVDRARAYADVAAPVFSLEDVTSLGRAQAGASYAYYIYFNNTGTGAAGSLWINETLPSEVAYAASSIPYTAVAGSTYTWALANVSTGSHMLEVDVGVLPSSTTPAWIHDNVTLEYTDASHHAQPPGSASAVVFLNGPVLTVDLSSSPGARIHANETLAYILHIRNSGADSGRVWMNDTLPTGFTYLSDNGGPLGAALTQNGSRLLYTFVVIPAAANWTITINVRAAVDLTWNASYVNALDVVYTSTNGYFMPGERANVSLIAVAPLFTTAQVTFLVSQTGPGEIAPAVIALENDGNEAAPQAWVRLALDTRLTIVGASRPFTTGPGTAEFALSNVGIGLTQIDLNVSVSPATVDGSLLQIKGNFSAVDGYGNPLPVLLLTRTFILVSGAAFSMSVTPAQATIEAGTAAPLAVQITNYGTSPSSNVWLNVTIPSGLEYENDTSGIIPTVVGFVFSYHWPTGAPLLQAQGRTAFVMNLSARAAASNGTPADVGFHLDYEFASQLAGPAQTFTVHAVIVAPTIVLRVEASGQGFAGGRTFNYSLRVTNTGGTVAQLVTVVDQVDHRLAVVSYASSIPASGTQNLTWNFTDLYPGETQTIDVTVRAQDGLPAGAEIANSIEAVYTNSLGTVLASIRSPPVTVQITGDSSSLYWILGVAAVLTLAIAVLIQRRDHAEIEEAFLVYRDGVLISHLSRTLVGEKDEDVLSGMLTAVQEFVREAFRYGERRELQQMDFGDYRILIERGKFVYLAVVYSGDESPAVRKKVRGVIEQIEGEYGRVLEKWDGDMESVVGAQDVMRARLLGSGNHNHREQSVPQYE